MNLPKVAILGAGPAGIGAAWQLAKQNKAEVIVLEQKDVVGGNAGSFQIGGIPVDYGSHRLHPACRPDILADLMELPGTHLLDRPRHGRIRLRGKWIHFPLKPLDLLRRLPPSFVSGIAIDTVSGPFRSRDLEGADETFASVLEKGLGKTISREFYFPYAEKIWGLPPESLSAIQARKRVSAGSLRKMIAKVLSLVPGFRTPGAGRFFYPADGYGSITESMASEALRLGVDIRLSAPVKRVRLGDVHEVSFGEGENSGTAEVDHIWSTIPITRFAELVEEVPEEVLAAGRKIRYRAMVLIYLAIRTGQWTEFDAHYFPEPEIRLTRLSEPKNYSARKEPSDLTVLCGELPCAVGDEMWTSTDEELGQLVADSLESCGLSLAAETVAVETRRLPFAYPIYDSGYERHFGVQDEWVSGLENVLTFGRQGLFAHDNTHHALAMAYSAVAALEESGEFNSGCWNEHRVEFAKHVVED